MGFKVQIAQDAQNDIDEAIGFIGRDSPEGAQKWLTELQSAILNLSAMPNRFAFIAESSELKRPLRSFPYHSHRVIYEVDEVQQIVSVVRVYHSARAPLRAEDFESSKNTR